MHGNIPEQELLDAYSRAVVACVERTAPSVVSLSVWQARRRRGEGSGLIVTPDGYILTNSHVVSGASSVVATFVDGEQAQGRVVGDDPATDLALVRVEGHQLPHAQVQAGPRPRPGQLAIAIGNPLGFDATVSSGVISALGRSLTGPRGELIDDLIQHTAPLNPGNSGGPLLASDGRVLGINSAMAGHSQAIGFAIPVETAAWVVGELLARGKVQRDLLRCRRANETAAATDQGARRPHATQCSRSHRDQRELGSQTSGPAPSRSDHRAQRSNGDGCRLSPSRAAQGQPGPTSGHGDPAKRREAPTDPRH